MLGVVFMKHISKKLEKIYLDKTSKLQYNSYKDRFARKMCKRLHKEFDQVWVKYNNEQATYQEWEKALDKWLNAEQL
jgi:hypothetical protein